MYFRLKCEHCGKPLKIREELAGRKCKCPYCKAVNHVPMPSSVNLSAMDLDQGEAPAPKQQPAQTAAPFPQIQTGPKPAAEKTPAVESPVVTKQQSATPRPTAPVPAPDDGGKWTDSSNVSLLASGLIGAGASVGFLALMLPLHDVYLGELFLKRGWVPFALVFLFFWSLAILVLKAKKLNRQKTSMLLDVVPTDISKDITLDTLDKYVDHVHSLPGEPGESFLINRVLRGLEHFRVRKSASEAASMLASQSEIDANTVASSYTFSKVFIWAIPIMGFIGTVIGIGGAVAGFSSDMDTANPEKLKESLNLVTGGLGTAFDTTLVALVMSVFIKFPTASLQRSEEALLNWVDEYCNENLLRRLNDGLEGGGERGPSDSKSLRNAVEKALASHHKELEVWTQRLKKIGETVSAQVAEGWEEVNGKLKTLQEQWAAQLLAQQEERARSLQQELEESAGKLQQKQDEDNSRFQQRMENMSEVAVRVQETLAQLTQQADAIQQQTAQSVNGSTEKLELHFEGLERGLTSLSNVLERLGEQQVVVQQVEKQKRGWFRRRHNGK